MSEAKLLCLSNGHGEDAIALRILKELQQHPSHPKLAALPLVGEGHAFAYSGISLAGPVKQMPSGGFIYMDGRQFGRDLKSGLLQLTLAQLNTVKQWARSGGTILAVGDIVPLLFAWWSGAPYAFVGTAKSEYYLRDEVGLLPRPSWFDQLESWSGSVYLPWERWLMSRRRCKAVFPRDRLTTQFLNRWRIPAFDLGNPMMDGLALPDGSTAYSPDAPDHIMTILLLPGSRAPEAYANWELILQAVQSVIESQRGRRLQLLTAIAPSLDTAPLIQAIAAYGWQADTPILSTPDPAAALQFSQGRATLSLSSDFVSGLHQSDFAIAMAGTATEQFVGLGKPAITIPGKGPQFTPAFAEAQTRLLGPSAIMVKQPAQVAAVIDALLQDPDRLHLISDNGQRRMGAPGAAQRIAHCLIEQLGY
ncbi:MAG TPA: lipid-A-disaccharide synthase-related protein [Chroococcidiopsis sp.]